MTPAPPPSVLRSRDRFTAFGGPEVEARLAGLCEELSAEVRRQVPQDQLHSLILLGGYGRGEGGVRVDATGEHPNNNLDLLLLTRTGKGPGEALVRGLTESLEGLGAAQGVGVDLSVRSSAALRRAEPKVMWYDMRFGHKTLLGDPDFVPSLHKFHLGSIPPLDMLQLLVNRGTLLLLNEALLAQGSWSSVGEAVLRHTAKAVIGYGDALLFFLGEYHWSYRERRQRMSRMGNVDSRVRNLYEKAMAHRFHPRTGRGTAEVFGLESPELESVLSDVHLRVESLRLGSPGLSWADYPGLALKKGLGQAPLTPRRLARGARAFLRDRLPVEGTGLVSQHLRLRFLPRLERLNLIFPLVAYRLPDLDYRRLAARVLTSPEPTSPSLRQAYLAAWGSAGDRNFHLALRRELPTRRSA